MYSAALLVPLLAGAVTAHMNPYHPSMYGVGDWFAFDLGDPFAPLGPGWEQDDWWFRGAATRALGPAQRSFTKGVLDVPAGGSITMEIACHVAWTSYGCCTTEPGSYTDACPYNTGAYHSGDPFSTEIDDNLLSGCALAIADKDDIADVGWDDLTIFSVQHDCVKQKMTTFNVPAKMPSCTGDKCICGWFWLANNGTANFYMTAFDCKVSGSPPDALPIAPPQDPVYCRDDPSKCTKGAKRPLYAYNNPTNVPFWSNIDRPGYHEAWSFQNGAQNDIFLTKAVASSSSVSVNASVSTSAVSSASTHLSASASSTTLSSKASSTASSNILSSSSILASNASSSSASSTKAASSTSSGSSSGSTTHAVSSSTLSSSPGSATPTTTTAAGLLGNVGGVVASATSVVLSAVSGLVGATSTSSSAAPAATTSVSSSAVNLALQAMASASSSWNVQPPSGANDGVVGGYDGRGGGIVNEEWSAFYGKAGTWYSLTWSSPVTFNQIVLWDRRNPTDNIMAGNITFDDGTGVSFGRLEEYGNVGTYLNLSHPVTAKSLTMHVTQVSPSTQNVGLAELQVFHRDASVFPSSGLVSPTSPPAASSAAATSSLSSSSAASASSSSSASMSKAAASSSTSASSSASSSPPSSTSSVTSSAASAAPTGLNNLALQAKASASSSWSVQPASGAIDGVVGGLDGYGGGVVSEEWGSYFGKVGAWYTLTWSSPVNLNQIVLWDRRNPTDNIMAGNVTFDDGTGVSFGRLDEFARVGTYLNLSHTVTTKTLRILVTQVSPTTSNVGLSEVQVYEADSSTFPSGSKLSPTAPVAARRLRARHARDFTSAEEEAAPEPTSSGGKDNATLSEEADEVVDAALLAPVGLTADDLFEGRVPQLADILQDER